MGRRSLLVGVSFAIVLSFSLLALNGILMISLSGSLKSPGLDERATAYDWPDDYLNGTVIPISSIHTDIVTYLGASVTVQGNVTAAPGEYDTGYFFVQDSTGGLMVNTSGSTFTFGVSRGDFVRLNGTVGQTPHGMHTIEAALSYWVMSTANSVDVTHMYNSSLVATSHQGMLVKMNGYLTNFSYSNTSHTSPDWERSICTSTLWMYSRTFPVQTTNMTLSDYEGFAMVTGIVVCYDDGYALCPRSTSDIEQGAGPYDSTYPDGDLSDWHSSEAAAYDSDSDCSYTGNELLCLYVAWDADYLYVALDYTIMTGYSAIIYIDAIPGVGADNVSALSDSSWSRHAEFMGGFKADVMIGCYEVEMPEVWRLSDNWYVNEITSYCIPAVSGTADGSGAAIEVGIPWNTLFGLGPGIVATGVTISMVATVSASDNTNVYDAAPDSRLSQEWSGWTKLYYFYDFCVDCDLDGYPDDYSSGFTIPEFSTLVVVPMMFAVVVLVARARRRKT